MLSTGWFWLLYLLLVVFCLMPAFVGKALVSWFKPWDSQIVREVDNYKRKSKKVRQNPGIQSNLSYVEHVEKPGTKSNVEDFD